MKFLKDYDFKLQYHLGKANVVTYALSRKYIHDDGEGIRFNRIIQRHEIIFRSKIR